MAQDTSPTTTPRDAGDGPRWLRVAQGLAMGSADVIPGVSGGTVALVLGIYTTLIGAVRSVASAGTSLLRGRRPAAREHWRDVPWGFILPLAVGILAALGIGSAMLPPLLETYPAQTSAAFFGMIVASLSVPWRSVDRGAPVPLVVAVACAVVAFLLMGLPALVVEGDVPTWRVFGSAAVAICAMILPGVSGAFLLLVLGVYEPTLEAVRDLDVGYIAVFVVGAVVGLAAFSKLLGHLLDRHPAVTMAGLTGLMLGALRVLWPWGGQEGELNSPPELGEALVALALAAVGFVLVRGLLALGDRSTPPTPAQADEGGYQRRTSS